MSDTDFNFHYPTQLDPLKTLVQIADDRSGSALANVIRRRTPQRFTDS
jgi:hypothetical protein